MSGEMEASDEEAGSVDEDDDDDDEVEIQKLGGLVEREAGLTVEAGGGEAGVTGDVGEARTAVSVGVQQGHRQGDHGGDTCYIDKVKVLVVAGIPPTTSFTFHNSAMRIKTYFIYILHTLTIEAGENDVPPGVVSGAAGSPHHVGELVREVDRHHVHPDEEADVGVVDGIAEEVADWSEENLLPIDEVKASFDAIQ